MPTLCSTRKGIIESWKGAFPPRIVPDLEAHGVSEFHSLDGLKHWLSS